MHIYVYACVVHVHMYLCICDICTCVHRCLWHMHRCVCVFVVYEHVRICMCGVCAPLCVVYVWYMRVCISVQ